MQCKFSAFKDKSHEQLLASPRLCSFSTKVLSYINAIIICRDRPGAVQELLNDLRRDHSMPARRVTNEDFRVITQEFS